MRAFIVVTALLCVSANAWSQDAAETELVDDAGAIAPEPAIDEVLVTGEQPGPGLWKITKPDAGHDHVLWVLGAHAPLPKKMTWRSKEVEFTIAESQAVLMNTTLKADIGFFRGLTLLPSLVGIRDNPDDAKLRDVVPPELYARWLVLKEKYIGRDKTVEKWRPIFAAAELYQKAIDKSGLSNRNQVTPVVEKLAKKHKLKIITPAIEVEISKPRAVIKEFKKTQVDDLACFAKTIERIETDLDSMRLRANAWSVGNITAMRKLPFVDQIGTCIETVLNHQLVKERGFDALPQQRADAWVAAAEAAMAKNRSTFAILSVDEIMKADGYVAQLRAKGYAVEEP